MTKKKHFNKNPYKKKQKSATHPYVELIQSEITALEDKLTSLQNIETNLTQEQEMDKLVTKATLERYKETLQNTTDATILSKVQTHHASLVEEGRKKQELQFLTTMQLFYLMRLGQLGLFQFMDTNAVVPLESIADLCDQMIGAAVHYANTPATSLKTRQEYRTKVFALIRKLDASADEPFSNDDDNKEEEGGNTTFKQVKEFLDHLWENTDKVNTAAHLSPPPLLEQADFPVLQFDSMMPTTQQQQRDTTSSSQDEETQEPVTPKTSLSISTATTHEEPKPVVTAAEEEPITHNNNNNDDDNKVEKEPVTYNGWGSSEDVIKKSAWGSERMPEEEGAPSNNVDNVQSTEKKRDDGFVENASTTSTSTTKSSKREKDTTEKRKKKKDSEGRKKDKSEEKKHKEPKESKEVVEPKESKEVDLPKKEEISASKDDDTNGVKEVVSNEKEHQEDATSVPPSEDKAEKENSREKQTEESNGWTTSIDVKKGGWDSPDDTSKPAESKDWEELKNNFGNIIISEDPPVTTTDMTDDSWKYGGGGGYSHHGGRGGGGGGRGRGRGGRGRGYSGSGYQPRGGYRGSSYGSRPPRGRGSGGGAEGDFTHRRYETAQ